MPSKKTHPIHLPDFLRLEVGRMKKDLPHEPHKMPLFYPLQALREKRGISQRALAKKLGLERTKMRRLEKKKGEEFNLKELLVLAPYFQLSIHELIVELKKKSAGDDIIRSGISNPFFKKTFPEGPTFRSLVPENSHYMVGMLTLNHGQFFSTESLSVRDFIFLYVTHGQILLATNPENELILLKRESSLIRERASCEIKNLNRTGVSELIIFALNLPLV